AFVMEPIGGRDMTMGGISLSVDGGDVTLTSASSPSIGTIELHTMAMNDGRMQMRQVESFDLADGQTLELKRGGNHFMMFDVGEDVVGGETIDITLNFDSAGAPMTLVVEADVRVVGE
ncbi:MAG: copper chaperone PCu(A)C, partial [Pseudomonadota bacterium]|nr:copper chaperone PCu(A)C [Pseudomonadota bacterium]